MGMTIIRILLVLIIMAGLVALIDLCREIFGQARRDMEDVSEDWRLMMASGPEGPTPRREDWRLKNEKLKDKGIEL